MFSVQRCVLKLNDVCIIQTFPYSTDQYSVVVPVCYDVVVEADCLRQPNLQPTVVDSCEAERKQKIIQRMILKYSLLGIMNGNNISY